MSSILACDGDVTFSSGVPHCSTDWYVVPYAEPADSTAIYAQLVALNEFDPLKIAGVVTFCFVMFIVGFGLGLVLRNLRRL
jgi:hypothetical protein